MLSTILYDMCVTIAKEVVMDSHGTLGNFDGYVVEDEVGTGAILEADITSFDGEYFSG